jgi:hypothetical protein
MSGQDSGKFRNYRPVRQRAHGRAQSGKINLLSVVFTIKGGSTMKWQKASGAFLLVLGVVLLVLSLLADRIGVGANSGFGYKQIIGVVLGVIAIIRGIWLLKG